MSTMTQKPRKIEPVIAEMLTDPKTTKKQLIGAIKDALSSGNFFDTYALSADSRLTPKSLSKLNPTDASSRKNATEYELYTNITQDIDTEDQGSLYKQITFWAFRTVIGMLQKETFPAWYHSCICGSKNPPKEKPYTRPDSLSPQEGIENLVRVMSTMINQKYSGQLFRAITTQLLDATLIIETTSNAIRPFVEELQKELAKELGLSKAHRSRTYGQIAKAVYDKRNKSKSKTSTTRAHPTSSKIEPMTAAVILPTTGKITPEAEAKPTRPMSEESDGDIVRKFLELSPTAPIPV